MSYITPIACVYIMVASWEREIIESSAVRYTTPTPLLADRMKFYTLVFVVTVFYTEYANARELCPKDNCVMSDKCEILMENQVNHFCGYIVHADTVCCNVIKSEFRTHCRHHGGDCMNTCSPTLSRNTVDCTGDQVCCVLV